MTRWFWLLGRWIRCRPLRPRSLIPPAIKNIMPEMFPGDPNRAAAAIYAVASSTDHRHWVILGSDAYRRIGLKLEMLRAEYNAGKDIAQSTDYPNASAPPIL